MIFFQIGFISVVVWYCLKTKKIENILCLLCLLLPFHGTVKTIWIGSPDFFSFWKEAVVIIFFGRIYKQKRGKFIYIPGYKAVLGIVAIYAGIGIVQGFSFFADMRNLLIPGLLLICIYNSGICRLALFKIMSCALVSSIPMNLTGVIDFVNPVARMAFRTLMNVQMAIGLDGTIYYDISSYKIMGIERVCGLMAGGPNQMGVYNSFIIIMCASIWYSLRSFLHKKTRKILFLISSLLSVFCLLTSFSRAGWAICAITLAIFLCRNRVVRVSTIFTSLLGFAILISIFYFNVDVVHKVIDGTFSGNEASSATRGSMTIEALQYWILHPWGAGLGATSDHFRGMKAVYFAESAFINIGICIGFIGFTVLLYFYYSIYKKLKKIIKRAPLAIWSNSFMIAIVIASCVSVNPLEMPFVYFSWMFMGFGFLGLQTRKEIKRVS